MQSDTPNKTLSYTHHPSLGIVVLTCSLSGTPRGRGRNVVLQGVHSQSHDERILMKVCVWLEKRRKKWIIESLRREEKIEEKWKKNRRTSLRERWASLSIQFISPS